MLDVIHILNSMCTGTIPDQTETASQLGAMPLEKPKELSLTHD